MKIALVSSGCLDSTMPLSMHLAEEKNVDVHLFGLMPKYNQDVNVIDFSHDKQPNGFVNDEILIKKMGPGLCQYLSRVKTRLFVYPAGAGKKNLLQDIYFAWKFSRHLIDGKFDIIHLIHTSNRFSLLLFQFLKKQKIVQTLHEVTAHSGDTSSYNIRILNLLVKRSVPVIFNSRISHERFLSYRDSVTKTAFDKGLYQMIRFSLYETYKYFTPATLNGKNIDPSVPVILHFGRIVPYKGIDILLEAVKLVQKRQPVHLIVAGAGKPYFDFEGIDSYEFINYSISNEEIISLVKGCSMVICPYRSVSQSGIPMTVFVFNKPIVASGIGGFKETIDNNSTGILVDTIDAASFATAIEQLVSNQAAQEKIADNIQQKYTIGEFSWLNIAQETTSFYQRHLDGN